MSWLNFFETKTEQIHQFGRGINANISPDEEMFFNKSYEAFQKQDILNAYKYFFKSLENFSNEISNCNITVNKEKDKLNFEIYQQNPLQLQLMGKLIPLSDKILNFTYLIDK